MTIGAFRSALEKENPVVAYYIYAAGFGKIGAAGSIPLSELRQMIGVNDTAAVTLTEVCLPYMAAGSRVAFICSVAAFLPIPYLNVYAGTKAFLYRYGRALSVELAPRRVGVTVVCPYWIRDTEFIAVARQGEDQPYFRRFPFASSTAFVAKTAWMIYKKERSCRRRAGLQSDPHRREGAAVGPRHEDEPYLIWMILAFCLYGKEKIQYMYAPNHGDDKAGWP